MRNINERKTVHNPTHVEAPPGNPVADLAARQPEWFERAPLAIGITHGVRHLIRRATPAFVRLIGTRADAVVDTPVAECITCLPAGRVLAILNHVYRTGEPAQDVEIARGTDDQTLASLSLTAWPVTDPKGRVTGLGLAVRDITREASERLQGVAALEEMHGVNAQLVLAALREDVIRLEARFASDAKEAFLATMSHELRTPLNAIIGYAELLADGISGCLNETQQAQVERIRASSRHLVDAH